MNADIVDRFTELLPKLDNEEIAALERVFDRHRDATLDTEILTLELGGLISVLQEVHAADE